MNNSIIFRSNFLGY